MIEFLKDYFIHLREQNWTSKNTFDEWVGVCRARNAIEALREAKKSVSKDSKEMILFKIERIK